MRAAVEGNGKAPDLLNGEIAEQLRGKLHLGDVQGRMTMRILVTRNLENTKYLKKSGARGRIRTTDTAIFSRLLYQLSYSGIWACAMRGPR